MKRLLFASIFLLLLPVCQADYSASYIINSTCPEKGCIESDYLDIGVYITNHATSSMQLRLIKLVDSGGTAFAVSPQLNSLIAPGSTRQFVLRAKLPAPSKGNTLSFRPCFTIQSGAELKTFCGTEYSSLSVTLLSDINCVSDQECSANEICISGECRELVCGPCSFIHDHKCINYECCSDDACSEDRICKENVCLLLSCNLSQKAVNHKCTDIVCMEDEFLFNRSCRKLMCSDDEYARDHSCQPLKCKDDEYISSHQCIRLDCKEDEIAQNHSCRPLKCSHSEYAYMHSCQPLMCGDFEIGFEHECRNFITGFLLLIKDRVVRMLKAPLNNREMMWLIIPILFITISMEFYFARYRDEELGWNTAFSNSLFLLGVGIALIDFLNRNNLLFEINDYTIITGILVLSGISLSIIDYYHILPKKIAFGVSSHLLVNIYGFLAIILVYTQIGVDLITIMASGVIAGAIIVFLQLIHIIGSTQYIETIEDRPINSRLSLMTEQNLKKGYTFGQLRKALLKKGYSNERINFIFNGIVLKLRQKDKSWIFPGKELR